MGLFFFSDEMTWVLMSVSVFLLLLFCAHSQVNLSAESQQPRLLCLERALFAKSVSNTLEGVNKDGRGLRKKGKAHQRTKRRSAGADKV